jgi:putative Mg2+ transporter-C (MgtC) family protein
MEELLLDFLKLMLAIGIGFLIGIEREKNGKPAGSRTLSLVCLSAAFITMITVSRFPADTEKVLSGIITGIGFLGAGTIIAQQSHIMGLTTAATIWAVAMVGIGIGLGEYWLSIIVATLIYFVLIERRIENKIIEVEKNIKDKKKNS